jgi:hypothetical protein
MIATLPVCQQPDRQAAEARFLEMLPSIRGVACFAFRRLRHAVREELIAEVVANAFCAFQGLVARGHAELAYASVLAWFAVRQIREGRRVGSKLNHNDLTSPYGQRQRNVSVQSLWDEWKSGRWQELVVEDRSVGPADVASFKIDFADWLRRLKRSQRQIALRFVTGDRASEVADHFRLTRARISQLRNELRQNWDDFQGEAGSAGADCCDLVDSLRGVRFDTA